MNEDRTSITTNTSHTLFLKILKLSKFHLFGIIHNLISYIASVLLMTQAM